MSGRGRRTSRRCGKGRDWAVKKREKMDLLRKVRRELLLTLETKR